MENKAIIFQVYIGNDIYEEVIKIIKNLKSTVSYLFVHPI